MQSRPADGQREGLSSLVDQTLGIKSPGPRAHRSVGDLVVALMPSLE